MSRATIWRWYRIYQNSGANELFNKSRNDKGKSRWFTHHPKAAVFVMAKYLGERMGVRAIARAMARDCMKLNVRTSELPSYDTILTFIKAQPQAPCILAREGERKFNEECLPYLRRKYTDTAANHIWVSGHMISDVLVWDDCLLRDGKARRLRLTMILDMRTRKALGYTFCVEGSSWSITTALRNAILRFGPCTIFYCDNGNDYKKVAREASVNRWWKDEMEWAIGLLKGLGIDAQHCLKYHPQSKHIERSFRTDHGQFDAAFVAGYTTGDAYKRPYVTRLAEHEQLLKAGKQEQSPLCPASIYIEAFQTWVEQTYNNAPHSGQGMDGRSPNQVYDELYPPTQRPKIELSQVAHLFYERKVCKVDSCAVRLNKRRYVGASAEATSALMLRNLESVQVAYDKNDPSVAVALDNDGNVIATLRQETLVPHSAEAKPIIAESMAERRRMQKSLTGDIRSLTDAARSMGILTEREHLEMAAGLGPNPDQTGSSTTLTIITPRTAPARPTVSNPERLQSEDIGERLAAELRRRNGTC
jgi:hypothetical protein